MNKSKYFFNLVVILAFIFLSLPPLIPPTQAQLPPEMQMDVLMTELKQELKAKRHKAVLSVIQKMQRLSSDLPASVLFIEARALAGEKRNVSAKLKIEAYLKKAGKKGKFYSEAIKLYVVVTKKV